MLVVIYKISASTQKKVCIYLLPVPAVAAILSISGDRYISKYSDLFEYGRFLPEGSSKFWGRRTFCVFWKTGEIASKRKEYSKEVSCFGKLLFYQSIDECQ